MAELALDRDFLPIYAKLQRPVQTAVLAAMARFTEHTHAGIHLEKLTNARDPNIRTIRITKFYRGVVLALGGERYLLHTVLPEEDANRYAVSRVFSVNQVLGVLEVRDQTGIDNLQQTTVRPPAGSSLFADVAAGDLTRLGIDREYFEILRAIQTFEQLESLLRLLPTDQRVVLEDLAMGRSADEVFNDLAERIVHDVDTGDLMAAALRASDRVRFVSGPIELEAVLSHPFDVWRAFLHPVQHDVAYRHSYSGPALVTGSAGTGKTVAGLHRAVFLAQRLREPGHKVLLTTYTRSLADALLAQLRKLTSDRDVLNRIDVVGVDRLAHQIATRGRRLTPPDEPTLAALWQDAADSGPTYVNRAGKTTRFSGAFLRREWEQVILAQQLTTLEAYQRAPRRGRVSGLRADQREQVWKAVAAVEAELAHRRLRTYTQLADDAAAIAQQQPPPYRHAVVDEGQDLHPAQWRLLRAMVAPGPDDLFVLADPYQRIYDSQVSLSQLGIEVRGRTRRLTVNYRTTREILDLAVRVLERDAVVGLDDEPDTLSGYRSVTRGEAPSIGRHTSRDDEYEALIERVGTWLEQGVEPTAIGVAARTTRLVQEATAALADAHIDVDDAKRAVEGVRIATMHSMKGLEFQCLALVGLDAAILPAAKAVTAAAEDALSHRQDMQRERCLLFAALTRARDALYLSHSGTPSELLPVMP